MSSPFITRPALAADAAQLIALDRALIEAGRGMVRAFVRLDDGSFIDDFIFARLHPRWDTGPSPGGSARP